MALQSMLFIASAMLFSVVPTVFGQQRNVLDSVYTDDQAERGAAQYDANCMKCHEGNDPDGPSLLSAFIDRWREDSLASLYTFIRTSMPRDEPGKLPESAYVDILAYILQMNGYAAGGRELSSAELTSIRLVGKNGPQPLPSNSLVSVVGCLTQDAASGWMLTNAAEPARIRRAEEATPEELRASAKIAPGTQTLRLQNATNPESQKDHRVQVKGVLTRQGTVERINVLILEIIAPKC